MYARFSPKGLIYLKKNVRIEVDCKVFVTDSDEIFQGPQTQEECANDSTDQQDKDPNSSLPILEDQGMYLRF